MTRRHVRYGLAALALMSWPVATVAQLPRIRIEFRLKDAEYRQAFLDSERARLEDSATALFITAFRGHFRFLAFAGDTADPTPRILLITLDQKDRGPSARLGEVGLHVLLRNPPRDSITRYWMPFRPAGADLGAAVGTVSNFLAELDFKLRTLRDSDWRLLLSEQLSRISIGDTAVTVWGSPPRWYMPYTRKDLCIDTRTGKVRVDNEWITPEGPDDREVIASLKVWRPTDSVPPQLARYKEHIHAKPVETAGVPAGDSLRVRGIYVVEYDVDPENCDANPTPPDVGSHR